MKTGSNDKIFQYYQVVQGINVKWHMKYLQETLCCQAIIF